MEIQKKKKKSNDEYDYKYIRIGEFYIMNTESGLNFFCFCPTDDVVDCRELEKPFEIHIDACHKYNFLLIIGAGESEDELELEDELEEDKAPKPLEESFRTDNMFG